MSTFTRGVFVEIKERIAYRIKDSRKKLGLSIKDLAEATGKLKASRISNWEQGTRAPGINEAKLLAKVLHVTPAYLLCLIDEPQDTDGTLPNAVPLISDKHFTDIKDPTDLFDALPEGLTYLPIAIKDNLNLEHRYFAIQINDESMLPEFSPGNILIIDADEPPKPAKFVIVKLGSDNKVLCRKYKDSGTNESGKKQFELVPCNDDWGTVNNKVEKNILFFGTAIQQYKMI